MLGHQHVPERFGPCRAGILSHSHPHAAQDRGVLLWCGGLGSVRDYAGELKGILWNALPRWLANLDGLFYLVVLSPPSRQVENRGEYRDLSHSAKPFPALGWNGHEW